MEGRDLSKYWTMGMDDLSLVISQQSRFTRRTCITVIPCLRIRRGFDTPNSLISIDRRTRLYGRLRLQTALAGIRQENLGSITKTPVRNIGTKLELVEEGARMHREPVQAS
ncbi:unnamed protein product [Taenia asiatica]|uniref:Uncharacterized protein n=1 Tax=Taenia asiatica TaxID=60517 RepID=A0A0R3VXF7_TAEAS|nr:unnamed protein product [Taenia asiatica]